ncbi:MAG: cation:proton antiporter [Candidatus Aenigmatarchaeota archaeon]|nr:MAG: cation:proton antiporter [Candidatus Aenigmarchaeota archaeon]
MVDVNTALTLIAAIIFVGFLASKIFERYKIPDILILMLLGLMIGPVFGVFGPTALAGMKALGPFFGTLVLIILLIEGGMSLYYKKVLQEAAPATLFALASFVGSVLLVSGVAVLFGWPLLHGLLLGSILGGTSSSVVMSLVRRINIGEETRTILSLESSINDSLTIISSIFLLQLIATGDALPISEAAQDFFGAFTISSLFALLAGALWLKTLDILKTEKYNYLLTLAAGLLLYVFTEGAGSNGAFAALVFGIVLGNSYLFKGMLGTGERAILKPELQVAQEEITFFVRTFFFVFMGVILEIATLTIATVAMALLVVASKAAARYGSAGILERFAPVATDRKIITAMLPNGLAAAAMAAYPAAFGITFGGEDVFLQVAFLVIFISNVVASLAIFKIESDKGKKRPEATR